MKKQLGLTSLIVAIAAQTLATDALAGPFTDPGIHRNDPRVAGWATQVLQLDRGPEDIAVVGSPDVTFGTGANALGPADAEDDFTKVVSLGDAGSLTVGFAQPIADIPGPDFVVFENTFGVSSTSAFAELGFVEVSSNGVDFFRFESLSFTPTTTQVGAFGTIDPTDVFNLAGKHAGSASLGTPFDLFELSGSPLLDTGAVTHVRIVDVVGSITPGIGSTDSLGNLINDPYPTASAGGGFDLDAIAVLQEVPEPAAGLLLLCGMACLPTWRR